MTQACYILTESTHNGFFRPTGLKEKIVRRLCSIQACYISSDSTKKNIFILLQIPPRLTYKYFRLCLTHACFVSTDSTHNGYYVLTDSTAGIMCSNGFGPRLLCFDRLNPNWLSFDHLERS